MAQFRTSRTFDIIFVLALGGVLWWTTLHRAEIGDWVFSRTHYPTSRTIEIADAAGLSPSGRQLLYRTDPQFFSAEDVTAQCDIEQLGCLTSKGQAIILDNPTNPNQTTVTAAHEMLHLAYRRLSKDEKARLSPMLDQAIALSSPSSTIEDDLKDQSSLDDRYDEAHSLLGTEYPSLPPALEEYYASYFLARHKVVTAQAASQQ